VEIALLTIPERYKISPQNMNVAILGGSFDPPHRGHVSIADRLLKSNNFDEAWLIPCYRHPFDKNLSVSNKRFEMTKCLEKNRIKVSDLEIKNKTINYTIDTLGYLKKKYPKNKFSLAIGADQVKDFTKWKKWKEIIDNFCLFIIPRTGSKKGKLEIKNILKQVKNPQNIVLVDKKEYPPIDISSTLIRKMIKEGKPISNLVPKKVEKYIIQNNLYRRNPKS
jgi:nicotinate-nucleotide adenylyltransferase